MFEKLVGEWLPKKAALLFEERKPNFVNLLTKDEKGVYQIILGTTKEFEEGNFEQFYILKVPYIEESNEEEEKEKNEANESPADPE